MSTQPTINSNSLFDLLPALYKLRDAQLNALSVAESAELLALQNSTTPLSPVSQQRLAQLVAISRGPLQSLLMLIDEQFALMANDLDQLYDDQFIETCAPWVIPYLGDLIGYQPVYGVATSISSPRAEVAHTISFRRRKGTVLVLEQLARDVTGWGAHAVEFFQLLATTQSVKHLRPSSLYAPNLRDGQACQYIGTAFDTSAHTAELRRIDGSRGQYNIQNIGIFLWTLNPYTHTHVTVPPTDASGQFYRFHPLGIDMPLFNNPLSQGSQISSAAQPINVPDRLLRRVLCANNQQGAGAAYYGEGNSLAVSINGSLLNPYEIQVCDLSGADGHWTNIPTKDSPYAAAIDPELGRIALTPAATPPTSVEVSFCYGFNGDMGGGEYPRSSSFLVTAETSILPFPDTATPPRYKGPYLQDAINYAIANIPANGQIALEITDSQIHPLTPPDSPNLVLQLPAGATVELRAGDGFRPTVVLNAEITVSGGAASIFQLNGLLVTFEPPTAGAASPSSLIHAPNDGVSRLQQLGLSHCTLVPGLSLASNSLPQYTTQASILLELPGTQLLIAKSIVGMLLVEPLSLASVTDSIVDACHSTTPAYAAADGASGGGALTLTSSTVIGKVHATLFTQISNSIVWAGLVRKDSWLAPLWADRKQQGCIRFSYLPATRVTPREYECVSPVDNVAVPVFSSFRYGDPGYAKLLPSTCDTVRRGADDGGEMGAFHFILAPMREKDLRVRLQEYLPVGLEFGIFYET